MNFNEFLEKEALSFKDTVTFDKDVKGGSGLDNSLVASENKSSRLSGYSDSEDSSSQAKASSK